MLPGQLLKLGREMGNVEQRLRKELARVYRDAEHEDARRRLGLTAGQLAILLDYLDVRLQETDCDHTLRYTETWLVDNYVGQLDVLAAMAEFGGYCDCEVLANVTPDRFGWKD